MVALTHAPHVLFVARWYPSHDQPGRGSFVADLAAALTQSGADVVVASFDPGHVRGVAGTRPARQAVAAGGIAGALAAETALTIPAAYGAREVPVARLPLYLDGRRRGIENVLEAHAAALLPFGRAAHARRPFDVIHAHTGLPDGVVAARLADELGLPLVVSEHASTITAELGDPRARARYASLLAGNRRLVAVSHALARDLAAILGVPEGRISVLPNAVPVEAFPLGDPAERESALALYVGSRKASKGIETLLRAFAMARRVRPDLRLRLLGPPGSPEEEAHWRLLAGELAVGAAVTMEGPAPRARVAEAMRQASLFVHPSPHETFGMVAAEALASGLPVAATPSGGVDEIIGATGRFGVVAQDTGPDALATAVLELLDRASTLDPSAMREHIVAAFGGAVIAEGTVALYEAAGMRLPDPRDTNPPGVGGSDDGDRVPDGPRAGGPPVVLAMARGQAVERVGLLPPALASRLTVVTSPRGKYADDCDLPDTGRWVELEPKRFYRDAVADLARRATPVGRVLAAIRGRTMREQRADLDRRRELVRADGIRQVLLEAARNGGAAGADGSTWLVCLDADDVLLARDAATPQLRLAPGGLRWLADGWTRPGDTLADTTAADTGEMAEPAAGADDVDQEQD